MNVIPQVTKSSPNPGGIGPPDSGPQHEALGADFSAALKGEMKGADLSADSGSESAQSDAQPFNLGAQKMAVPSGTGQSEGGKVPTQGFESGLAQKVEKGTSGLSSRNGLVGNSVQSEVLSPLPGAIRKEVPKISTDSLKQQNQKSASRDESREALAGAAAQGVNPALIPQLVMPVKGMVGENREESGSKGQKSLGPKPQGFNAKGSDLLQQGFNAGAMPGKESAEWIPGVSREFIGGDLPHLESVSVDPRVSNLLSQSDLNVKSFELKQGASPAAAAALTASEKPAESGIPNRVSTEDFLSLRGVKKEKSSKGQLETRVDNPLMHSQAFGKLHLGPVLEAPVTQGTAGKPILSHDALNQITQQVSGMSQAKQDGEIKIRLKPDHLGELMMSVKTSGDKVAVQIKAQDHQAKKIIEDSLGRLKDSLSSQNLTLHKVDVVTQPSASQSSDAGFQMDFGPQSQGNFGRNESQQFQDSSSNGRQEFHYDERPVSSNLKSINPTWARRSGGSGGLDLIA